MQSKMLGNDVNNLFLDQGWSLHTQSELANQLVILAHHCAQDQELCRGKRDANPPPPDMPVVFLPQKSQTECERVSRMSSWGFMSFVLAIINGVINISNNINNNNNNRNNNNNDDNNNEMNANVANSNNVQMAAGMAMSGRRLPALARLEEIREKFRRKLETKVDVSHVNDNVDEDNPDEMLNLNNMSQGTYVYR